MIRGMALVLIVQDHDRARSDLAATLRTEGHSIIEATTAQVGTELARSSGPEAILLDPTLPDRSGYELYASLQRDQLTRTIPVLFLPTPFADRGGQRKTVIGGIDIVTRLGIALRTRVLHEQLRERNPELRLAVLTDSLTGLANLRALQEQVRVETERAGAGGGLSAVLADLDHFNQVNERYGYAVGDHLLQAMAGLLHGSCRAHDTVGRWRGGGFLLLLPGTRLDAAWHVAERVRERTGTLTSPVIDEELKPSASFGVTEHQDQDGPADLVGRAEAALQRAKRAGRNRCEVS
jgi:diguanylate cyclase (GGDEF)-like protein